MKFQFKIQQYQTEAVEGTVNVFRGQPRIEPKHYRRDIGKIAKGSIFSDEEEAGYRHAADGKVFVDVIKCRGASGSSRGNNCGTYFHNF